MSSDSSPSSARILKVGGVQAAQLLQTAALINKLRSEGSLAVVLSAPNTDFRTTNVLIQAAECCAVGDKESAKNLLQSVQDFVLDTVCEPIVTHPRFPDIRAAIEKLFRPYLTSDILQNQLAFFMRKRSTTAPLMAVKPAEGNDYVGTLWRVRGGSKGHRKPPELHSYLPFLELGEDISAIIYSHLTDGVLVNSRACLREGSLVLQSYVKSQMNHLVISGALRLDVREKMLERYGRGYTDANAGRLAVHSGGELLVHKQFPICTANPDIVNGASQRIPVASMAAIQSSLHPLVGAQFLNQHVFAAGQPRRIQVGVIGSENVTDIVSEDLYNALPLIQKGPRVVRHENEGEKFSDQFRIHPEGDSQLISIIGQQPYGAEEQKSIIVAVGDTFPVGSLDNRTISVAVPCGLADEILRKVHHTLCGQ